jgi:hypothetical protein
LIWSLNMRPLSPSVCQAMRMYRLQNIQKGVQEIWYWGVFVQSHTTVVVGTGQQEWTLHMKPGNGPFECLGSSLDTRLTAKHVSNKQRREIKQKSYVPDALPVIPGVLLVYSLCLRWRNHVPSKRRTLQERTPSRPGNLHRLPLREPETQQREFTRGAMHPAVRHSSPHSHTLTLTS